MLVPREMVQITIFAREGDVEEITTALARLQLLDLSDSGGPEWSTGEEQRWRELSDNYSHQERQLQNLASLLEVGLDGIGLPEEIEPGEDSERIERELREKREEIDDWHQRADEARRENARVDFLIEEMRILEPLDIAVEQIRDLDYLHLRVGAIPRENLASLQVILHRIPFVLIPFHEAEERVLVFAAAQREQAPILDRTLRSLFVDPVELPENASGQPVEVIEQLKERRKQLSRKREELEEEKLRLSRSLGPDLERLHALARSNRIITGAVSGFGRHQQVYLLTGWAPRSGLDALVEVVREASEGRADLEVLGAPAQENRNAPTLLRNPRWLKPFESLVSTFGFPSYGEVDPTPLVALTFLLMYGMMFGDVGHGLLLALAGLGLWSRWKQKTLGAIIVAAALSAILFGFLYGSLFGREDLLPRLWLSPMGSIGGILGVSVAAGVILINLGFLLRGAAAIRTRDWGELLFDRNGIAGFWLYWMLIGGLGLLWLGSPVPPVTWGALTALPALVLFFSSPLDRWISGEKPLLEESWGEYGIQAFFELFETIIADISNSLSFIRLGAFAVAHVGLSHIVFSLADLAGVAPLQWAVLLVGTLVLVAFEGLIVGIQALRLEYYEFFSRFFRGRGRAFSPLNLSGTD